MTSPAQNRQKNVHNRIFPPRFCQTILYQIRFLPFLAFFASFDNLLNSSPHYCDHHHHWDVFILYCFDSPNLTFFLFNLISSLIPANTLQLRPTNFARTIVDCIREHVHNYCTKLPAFDFHLSHCSLNSVNSFTRLTLSQTQN